jgi:hypothetical protein
MKLQDYTKTLYTLPTNGWATYEIIADYTEAKSATLQIKELHLDEEMQITIEKETALMFAEMFAEVARQIVEKKE